MSQNNTGGLILKMKQGDQLMLGDDVVLTVRKSSDKNLSLHFQAPKSIPILLKESGDARKVAK